MNVTNKSPECGVTGHSTVTKSFKTIIYQFTQQPFENAKILSLHHFFSIAVITQLSDAQIVLKYFN